MRTAFTAIGAVALLALVTTGCARMMAQSEDGSTQGSDGMSGSSGPGGSGAGGSVYSRAGRAGSAMNERPPIKEFQPAIEMVDVHFDFDRYDLRPQDEPVLQSNAAWLRTNKNYLVLIEGHTDERGTAEYNVALGERRAKATQNYLVSRGIDSRRISIISYGEHRQLCTDATENCWAKNRRAHFQVKRQ